jgi:predicted dehydrogenase
MRKKPKGQVETFSLSKADEYEEVEVKTEDYGAIMFKMDNGAHGVFHVSQISAGRKCHFNFEVNGSKSSMYWNQEKSDQMWVGFKEKDNLYVMRNPLLMAEESRQYTYLAAGHPEGWNDAMRNSLYSYYKFISEGKQVCKDACDFATFEEGHYIMKLTEAILQSSKERKWVKVE